MADGERTYRGVPGAFRYSFRTSASLTYKSYVLVSALLTLLIVVLFTLGVIRVVYFTLGASELDTLGRAFFVLVGVAVATPILAPVLLVARRHRKSLGSGSGYDAALALGGYLFIASLYLGLLVSVPSDLQESVSGPIAPIVGTLYALPQPVGAVPPLVAAALIVALHRRYR